MAKKSNRRNETPQNEEVVVTPKDENVYPDAPRGADAQNLGLEETRKAREEEAQKTERPESEHGMYGNTKPFSQTQVEATSYLETEATEEGGLELLSARDRRNRK